MDADGVSRTTRQPSRDAEVIAGRRHLERAYGEALRARYLWHEFGDAHLTLLFGMMETA